MRLFIAIELPDAIKRAIAQVQARLREGGASANWTRPEGIHLTLKFLGEVAEEKVPLIMQALTVAARGTGSLNLAVAGAGGFPNERVPRVLWLGLTGDVDRLTGMQDAVETAMAGLGFEREKRVFSPHLTLARVKFPKPRDNWQQRIENIADADLGEFEVGQVNLMESELKREGAVYRSIGNVKLQ